MLTARDVSVGFNICMIRKGMEERIFGCIVNSIAVGLSEEIETGRRW